MIILRSVIILKQPNRCLKSTFDVARAYILFHNQMPTNVDETLKNSEVLCFLFKININNRIIEMMK